MPAYRVVPSAVVRIGDLPVPRGGASTWGPGERGNAQAVPGPAGQLDRVAWHGNTIVGFTGGATTGFTSNANGQVAVAVSTRILTDEDCQLIYQRCSDVRAAINSIAGRVATADWDVVPTTDVADPEYDAALEECAALREWFQRPNADDVWQEIWTAVVADALKFPAGVVELVTDGRGKNWTVDEMVPVRGANFHPICDEKGRLVQYVQQMFGAPVPGGPMQVALDPDRVLYLRIAATTESREPIPLLESLIYEISAILHGNEAVAKSLNANEVPAGVLVLIGLSKDAQERARAQYEAGAGQPWKLRLLMSQDPGSVDAKWVEFRKTAKEMDTVELVKAIRRAVWRVFGVMPVEMGETDATPRATAEVQVDAGGSHLITPFLDLLETKINTEILPRRTGRTDVRFAFKRSRDLTPAERVQRADELTKYLAAGVLTRNQVRKKMPEPADPIGEDGDVYTVESSTIRTLHSVLEEVELEGTGAADTAEAEDPEAEEDGPTEDPEADAEDDVADPEEKAASRPTRRRLRVQVKKHGHANRSLRDEVIPSAWRNNGVFAGTRTLRLERLWDEITGYQRDVAPLWEEARTAVIQAVASKYKTTGFTAQIRAGLEQVVAAEIDRLLTRWSLSVAPRYGRVAEDARGQAGDWTGVTDGAEIVKMRAELYRVRAMGYLTDPDGLLTDLRNRLILTLVAVTDVRTKAPDGGRISAAHGADVVAVRRARRATGLGPEATTAAVLEAVGRAFDALAHRIGNWAARLIELASETLAAEVMAGAGTGRADGVADAPEPSQDAVDWWCEWASVGDEESCETCLDMGSRGYIRVADLRVHPGGGTECRANCRCTLVYWTKGEIDDGEARLLGGGNTGRTL